MKLEQPHWPMRIFAGFQLESKIRHQRRQADEKELAFDHPSVCKFFAFKQILHFKNIVQS